jgi:hypothetical protein
LYACTAAVLTYLDSNFPSATFEHASKKTKGDKLGYRVELIFNNEHYSVFFDATGAFLHQITGLQGKPGKKGPAPAATEIALADLPAAVKSAISGYTFKRAILVKDPNGVEIYHIRIEKVGIPYDLAIDATGKILFFSRVFERDFLDQIFKKTTKLPNTTHAKRTKYVRLFLRFINQASHTDDN